MFPKPKSALVPNTYPYESEPMVKATGFREYDARWLFGKEINLMGIQALGMGLGALIAELGAKQEVVTGHDFRGYSASIKYALISGMEAIGCEVVPLDTELDYTFPKYNPNPEDMEMLHAMRDAVLEHRADLGLGFDGDGDRCGVVDNTGEEIFADKVGVMLARDMSAIHKNAQFVVDVKSTGLFITDPVLQQQGAKATYWKTGHSYMKRRTNELGALAGFEKSGHVFFNKPFGRGYDDGLVSAIAVCEMLDRALGKSMADLKNALPKTWSSPTMSPHCADEVKYGIVDAVVKHFEALQKNGEKVGGQK